MTGTASDLIRQRLRDVPDFPKPGIVFKDITPLLADPNAFNLCLDSTAAHFDSVTLDAIVGIESRGFIFGAALASRMRVAFIPARKPGKLPYRTKRVSYDLEYGTDSLEMHDDAIKKGDRILIVDDLLATGGTAWAACELVRQLGGTVVATSFVVELTFLAGRERLRPVDVFSLVQY
ncbi:MAG TPA: adenine phosphoribosyltransferase [Polyangiales bacterium]|nr:adenine phosphoribosyltransferase [Polyangiales bacterium]